MLRALLRRWLADPVTMEAALARCAARAVAPRTVIDVGASDGRWSILARKSFPGAHFFMVEARKEHAASLAGVCADPAFSHVISAAGDRDGEVYFDATDLFGGQASDTPYEKNGILVPVRRLDDLAAEHRLQGPFALKLDTHGYELPILAGAAGILRETKLLIIECYNFRLTDKSLLAHEMCAHLEKCGFRCIDLCEPLYRPKDGALWQMDLFFAPASDRVFGDNVY